MVSGIGNSCTVHPTRCSPFDPPANFPLTNVRHGQQDGGMPNPDDLISASEAADLLGISLPTLHRLARDEQLPVALKGDGIRGPRWFLRSDIEARRDEVKAA